MKKCFFTLVIITIMTTVNIFSQNYQSGIIVEVAGLATDKKDFYTDKSDDEFIGAFALSYSGKVRLCLNYHLEITVGYFSSLIKNDYFFSGTQLGLFIKRVLYDSLFFSLGIDSKINLMGGHGTAFYTAPKRLSFFIGSKIGWKLNKDFSILITYLKTLDEYSGYGQNYETAYKKYLYWLIKFGIEYNL